MKVGVYVGVSSEELGGAEYSAAVLAEALGNENQVEFIHHNKSLTKERLQEFCQVDLARVCLRYEDYDPKPFFGDATLPWARYRQARSWSARLSKPYQLFINFTHEMPPFCHAPRGILVVLFPSFNRAEVWPWKSSGSHLSMRKYLSRAYYNWEWKQRFGTYQIKFANSLYTKGWTKKWWGVDCSVLYPPADCQFREKQKKKLILSVGRFTGKSRSKNQLEMVRIFGELAATDADGWQYISAGGLSCQSEDQAYFSSVKEAGVGLPVTVLPNLPRDVLKQLYDDAALFWHAAGYELNEQNHPELQEHFGITTVEAMAAGCVPVVIDKGGQTEIVEHGVSGFLWRSVDELKRYTRDLMADCQLRETMSAAARVRAQRFTRDAFVRTFFSRIGPCDS